MEERKRKGRRNGERGEKRDSRQTNQERQQKQGSVRERESMRKPTRDQASSREDKWERYRC